MDLQNKPRQTKVVVKMEPGSPSPSVLDNEDSSKRLLASKHYKYKLCRIIRFAIKSGINYIQYFLINYLEEIAFLFSPLSLFKRKLKCACV